MGEKRTRLVPPNPNGTNSTDRELLGQILLKMGYCVKFTKEKQGKRTVSVIEYWTEEVESDDGEGA